MESLNDGSRTSKPTVTVIIPTWNRWPHICDAIDSVLAQSYAGTRCLVVDDHSTDGTVERLADKYARHESALTILELETNRGPAVARNFGVRHADSDYICFLDSDDLLAASAIEDRVSLYRENPDIRGFVFGFGHLAEQGKADSWGQKERGNSLSLEEYLSDRRWLNTNTVMMPKSLFLSTDGFNETLRNQEDIEFFIRLLCHNEAVYCGTRVSQVRTVADNRARHDVERMIEEGHAFFIALAENKVLREVLGKRRVRELLRVSKHPGLGVLYKAGRYQAYRKRVAACLEYKAIWLDAKTIRRYVFSYPKQWAATVVQNLR